MTSKTILLHVHLFKNAGTSIESSLHDVFQSGWVSYDGPTPGHCLLQTELETFLREHNHVTCVSSHQVRPPLVASEDFRYLPIVFLRHPIDRIRSAYEFERGQGPVSPSARAAAESTLAEWIDFHDGRGSAQCANFQTLSLSSFRNDTTGAPLMRIPMDEHFASAVSFLDSLGAVGVVEDVETSMRNIQVWLKSELGQFSWTSQFLNTGSSTASSLDARLSAVAAELGPDRYAALLDRNQADLELHRRTTDRMQQ